MNLQALLISNDAAATSAVGAVLSASGVAVCSCANHEAPQKLGERRYDAVAVDFDEAVNAAVILQNITAWRPAPITLAFLSDHAQLRKVLGAGANFIIYKPVTAEQAECGLRAPLLLMQRERRRSFRVPIQSQLQLQLENGTAIEGILLDLSEDGLDVLAAQPSTAGSYVEVLLTLPETDFLLRARAEVAWANPNGQTGVRFVGLTAEQKQALKSWVTANAPELGPEAPMALPGCELTDLSLGACYIKTESPFPERSGLEIELKAGSLRVDVLATVRAMHPGCGMGVEFAPEPDRRAKIASLIGFLCSHAESKPEISVAPRALRANFGGQAKSDEFDDPLLELLHHHESYDHQRFQEALEKQRCVAQ